MQYLRKRNLKIINKTNQIYLFYSRPFFLLAYIYDINYIFLCCKINNVFFLFLNFKLFF